MPVSRIASRLVPVPLHPILLRHRETLRFLVTGGVCFVATIAINYALKLTVLSHRPVTALTIATVVTMVASYFLSREWSFSTRGGRGRLGEASLFFLVSGIAVGINDLPLYVSRYVLDLRVPEVSRAVQETADFTSGIVIGTLLAMVFRLWGYRRFVFPTAGARAADTGRRSDRRFRRPGTLHPVTPTGHTRPDLAVAVRARGRRTGRASRRTGTVTTSA